MKTHVFSLESGEEVLTVFERTPVIGGPTTYTVVFPSRRIDPATPEKLAGYAKVWSEAARWLEERGV